MQASLRKTALLLAFLVASGCSTQLDDPAQPEAFTVHFVEAVKTRSPERLRKLLHPASLDCIGADSQPYYDDVFSRRSQSVIPADYDVHVKEITADAPLMFETMFDYPVRPSHEIEIDYATGENSSRSVVLQVIHDGKRWREVMPCPKPSTLAQMQAAERASAQAEEKVKRLVASMPDPLREELVALLEKGHRLQAIKRYRAATDTGLATSKRVVELLLEEEAVVPGPPGNPSE